MTIHLIEDDEAVSDALSMVLTQRGYEVATYRTGEEFRSARPRPNDTVFLDLMLPDMTGAKVLQSLEEAHPKTRVFVITGVPKNHIDQQLPDFDRTRVFRKPIDVNALTAAL